MNRPPDRIAVPRVAEDVVIRDSVIFEAPEFTNGEPTLCEAEIAFFKEHGFLLKRGFLNQQETFDRVIDHLWNSVPRGIFTRDDPQSWIGTPADQWTEEDDLTVGVIQAGAWKMRSKNGIGTEPFMRDEIGNHPRMREMATRFLGDPLKRAERVRGLYCVFPIPPGSGGRLSPHADQTAADLSAMVFVDEVAPHCGGFTLWPGSHHTVHPHCETVHGAMSQDQTEGYARARDSALNEITPMEFPGQAGDVIFWHPRMIHSGGVNRSAELDRPALRLIVPCDYQRADRTFYDNLIEGPGPNHQWWVDTRNYKEDVPPTPDNIWDAWAFK
jgi:hypothetical protein